MGINAKKWSKGELDRLPEGLRSLLERELQAGNEILEIGHSFPAPPAGLYVKLARPITTRPHESADGIEFYDRDTPYYSGEFNDPKRFFFILEPPRPPPPEPDMDSVREAHSPGNKVSSGTGSETLPPPAESALARFESSMAIDYEKWHDGVGYDLDAIEHASPKERKVIEDLLIERKGRDWRDIEALSRLDTERSRGYIREAFGSGGPEVRMAVLGHAPETVTERERTDAIIHALREADVYGGLSQALDMVEEFHPPEVVEELFRGVQLRRGDVAIHLAAMLLFVYGKAEEPFDWSQRPFLLRFNTEDESERKKAFVELCHRIGVLPDDHQIPE